MGVDGGENGAGRAHIEVPEAAGLPETVKGDVFVLRDDAEDGEGNGESKKVEDEKEKGNVDEGVKDARSLPPPDGNGMKVGKDEVALLAESSDEKEREKAEEIEKMPSSLPESEGNEKGGDGALPPSGGNEKETAKEIEKGSSPMHGNEKENSKETEKADRSMSISDGNEEGKRQEHEKGDQPVSPSYRAVLEKSKEMETAESDAKGEESSSVNKENLFPHDLKEQEKTALMELRSKLEYAILKNKLYKKVKDGKKEESQKENLREEKQEPDKVEEEKDKKGNDEEKSKEDGGDVVEKGKAKEEEEEQKLDGEEMVQIEVEVDKDITLWGVPLLPSKGDKRTDVLLLKFLIAREFKSSDAFEMLRNTLQWRKEQKIDSILDEDFGHDYDSVGYMKGLDREGHPVCYNAFGVFADDEVCEKTFGSEASRERFLRWRLQLLEKEIQKLDFRPGGISTLVQINDLKECPGPARKDLRLVSKQAVAILQDNYPEFVARNVRLLYLIYRALYLNRTNKDDYNKDLITLYVLFFSIVLDLYQCSLLVLCIQCNSVAFRNTKGQEQVRVQPPVQGHRHTSQHKKCRYIRAEEIPVAYGGLQRENDPEFSAQHAVFEAGNILMWELTIIGWDVSYKEEFVPTDEESYTVIVKKGRKISWQDEPIRNSYKNTEPGKVVITIENGMFKKKKVLYRYKTKNPLLDDKRALMWI
ncbi:UNVERIFIED_CONTAM: Patellin-4 [Sesamum radiatum]|uniref:Patellin-4 n=1 Tax=Sesamum radiatum TaxID=300843 RepID=A0AAW2LS39_SESRA